MRKPGRPTHYTPEQDAQLLTASAHALSDLSERWGKSVLALQARRNKVRAAHKPPTDPLDALKACPYCDVQMSWYTYRDHKCAEMPSPKPILIRWWRNEAGKVVAK